jgi:hypothetical protein
MDDEKIMTGRRTGNLENGSQIADLTWRASENPLQESGRRADKARR